MIGYYLHLALRTLRRNIVLTSLIIAAVGVGIGAYMTVLTVLMAMSGDPIPDKVRQAVRAADRRLGAEHATAKGDNRRDSPATDM